MQIAARLAEERDSRLLYLVVFGSELYGLSTEASDLDLRGVFLPSLQSVILGRAERRIHFSTGGDKEKNTQKDMDIDLWSLQDWLLRLLPGGDIGALDMLFSPSNPSSALFRDPLLDPLFNNPAHFLDLSRFKDWRRYCMSQCKKYGIRGSRMGALMRVQAWLESNDARGRLEASLEAIAAFADDREHCRLADTAGGKALFLCGKLYPGHMKMNGFRAGIKAAAEKLGAGAKLAELNQGLDYKALSHALRALDQMEELLRTGGIKFPLKSAEELMKVKEGGFSWKALEERILSRMGEIETLQASLAKRNSSSPDMAEKFLLHCYGV